MQKIIRIAPPGYSHTNIKTLNELLREGWKVIRVDPVSEDGDTFNDYLIEKD